MATKKTQSKNKSNHQKRTAASAPKSAAEKEALVSQQRAVKEKEAKKKQTANRGKKIAAVVFSVILILAFAIPSMSVLVSNSSNADSSYEAAVKTYTDALEKDATEYINYINLASLYYDWGVSVKNGTETSKHETNELFQQAIDNYLLYGEYTTLSSDSSINLALAYYYTGDTANALATLQNLVAAEPDNAMANAYLGYMYAESGDTTTATQYYNKAIELDPDDTTGAKTYATNGLSYIEGLTLTDADLTSNTQ